MGPAGSKRKVNGNAKEPCRSGRDRTSFGVEPQLDEQNCYFGLEWATRHRSFRLEPHARLASITADRRLRLDRPRITLGTRGSPDASLLHTRSDLCRRSL